MITIQPPTRGNDKWGNGAYLARRGNRKHKGIDFACIAGSRVLAVSAGKVTKIGFPYDPNDPKKGHLRYIQITDSGGFDVRYFYVDPCVDVDISIVAGAPLGKVQDLGKVYPGITSHFHFEVIRNGKVVNPDHYIEGLELFDDLDLG